MDRGLWTEPRALNSDASGFSTEGLMRAAQDLTPPWGLAPAPRRLSVGNLSE
jgi:hypothetical protein